MQKISLRTRCLEYLKRHPGVFINAAEIGDKAHALPEHYKHDTTSRRLRELAEEGLIRGEVRPSSTGKQSVYYMYQPQERTVQGTEIIETPEGRKAILVERKLLI